MRKLTSSDCLSLFNIAFQMFFCLSCEKKIVSVYTILLLSGIILNIDRGDFEQKILIGSYHSCFLLVYYFFINYVFLLR